MSRLITNAVRSTSATADAITMDGSGNVTFPANATCSGTATGFGKILQVIQTTKTDTFTTTTTSYSDVTGLSANITTTGSNKVLVMVQCSVLAGDAGTGLKIMRGSNDIFLADSNGGRARHTVTGFYTGNTGEHSGGGGCFMCYLDTPSAGTHTYKVQCMTRGGTIYINRTERNSNDTNSSVSTSSITLQEVAA